MGKKYLILLKHPEVYNQPITIDADNFEWDSDDKTVSFFGDRDIRIAIFNMEELIGIVRVQEEEDQISEDKKPMVSWDIRNYG